MGLFNFNRAKKSPTAEAAPNGWNNLAQQRNETQPVAAAEQARQAEADKQRQERKVIGAIVQGPSVLGDRDAAITQEQREQAYQRINDGQFDSQTQSAILRKIATPDRSHGGTPDSVFQQMDSKHARRIFAFMNGIPDTPDNMRQLSSDIVTTTLSRYPTPIEFAARSEEMLSRIKARNPEDKYQEYVRDMDLFKHQLFGKRQEYYDAFQAVTAQAEQYKRQQDARRQVLQTIRQDDRTIPMRQDDRTIPFPGANTATHPGAASMQYPAPDERGQILYPEKDLGYLPPEMQERWRAPAPQPPAEATPAYIERAPVTPVEVYRMNSREQKQFLKKGKIEGDPALIYGRNYELTPKFLEQCGLAPEFKTSFDGAEIGFSRIYQAGSHSAVTAYVKTDKGIKIVSYYRSNSQGTWRYMPDYVNSNNPSGSPLQWLGKGYDEESLNLPGHTQQALEIISNQPHADVQPGNAYLCFMGTAKAYSSKDEYRTHMHNHTLRGSHYQEVQQQPSFELGKLSRNKTSPESLDIPGTSAPDFSAPQDSYQFQTGIYGPVEAERFSSQDGKVQYTFNRDSQDRAWLGRIEVQSPLSSAGLRTEWAQAGDYGTPLYEYRVQASGYGDESDTRGNHYVSMWRDYLSRMPLIRKYLNSRQQRQNFARF